MKKVLLAFILCGWVGGVMNAQKSVVKVDTVQRGFYVTPDSTWDSFLVTVFMGGVAVDQMVVGTELPPEVILMIIVRSSGDSIMYHEMNNGQGNAYDRVPSRQYVIGEKNTVKDIVDARGDTVRITAIALADIRLDSSVIAFSVFVGRINGPGTQFGCSGNTIPEERKAFIRSLQPGQRVYFQMMLVRNPDGSTYRIPQQTYIITE